MKTPKCYTWLESCGSHLSCGIKKKYFFASCRAYDFLGRSAQIFSFILRSCHIWEGFPLLACSHNTTTHRICPCSPLNWMWTINSTRISIIFTTTLQYWSAIGFSVCVLLTFLELTLNMFHPSGEDQHGFWNCVSRGVRGLSEIFFQTWIRSHLVCQRSLVIARRCLASWNTISSVRWSKTLEILAFFGILWFLRLIAGIIVCFNSF